MPAPQDIAIFKKEMKDLLIQKSIGEVLLEMKLSLPAYSDKHNQLLELQARLNRVNHQQQAGMLSFDEQGREYAKITNALIALIDSIEKSDFEVQGNAQSDRKRKRGSILYRIPNLMQLNKETKCIVRLAFLEELLKENIELTEDTHIQSIRISEVMSVELLDRSQQSAFSITTHNQAEQFLDEDDYSEWIFYVKPLLEGIFPLVLKVSVIEEVRGKERVREIMLEESIRIVTGSNIQDTIFHTAKYKISRIANKKTLERLEPVEVEIFICYSNKDEEYRKEIEDLLSPKSLYRQYKKVSIKDHYNILGGQKWKVAITENIRRADIILYLLSSDFLSSEDVRLDRHIVEEERGKRKGSLQVVSILVRDCDWENMNDISPYKILPSSRNNSPKSIQSYSLKGKKDAIYVEIKKDLDKVINLCILYKSNLRNI